MDGLKRSFLHRPVATTRPLVLEHGMAMAPDQAGIGVEFIAEKLEPHEVKI